MLYDVKVIIHDDMGRRIPCKDAISLRGNVIEIVRGFARAFPVVAGSIVRDGPIQGPPRHCRGDIEREGSIQRIEETGWTELQRSAEENKTIRLEAKMKNGK